jgi:hypothetical protein
MTTKNIDIDIRNIVRPILLIAIGIVIGINIGRTNMGPRAAEIGSVRGSDQQGVSRAVGTRAVWSTRSRGVEDLVTVRQAEDAHSVEVVKGVLLV